MEMATKAFLVGKPREAENHRVSELTVGKKRQGCGFPSDLIFSIVHIRQELNFGNGNKTVVGEAY